MVRNILAVIAGLVIGSVVNMGLVMLSPVVIPTPAGADTTTIEGLNASIHLFETKHFIFPFLAHALGTLVGALVAALISVNRKLMVSLIVGCFFLVGGLSAAWMIPAPVWFEAVDILFAYIPMAWIGAKLAGAGRAR
jgi:hypothetical protein